MGYHSTVHSLPGLMAILLLAACGGGSDGSSSAPALTGTAPTVTLTSSPASIASGDSLTLTWSSTDATSCTASGGWSGTKATSGSESVGPLSATTSYTLSCSGAGGTTDRTASIVVVAQGALHITSGAPPNGTVGVFYNRGNGQTCFYLNGHSGYCYPCSVGGSLRPCPAGYVYQNSFEFRAAGGAPPYIWAAVGLPPGLTVNADGTFHFSKYCCKPQNTGTYGATVTVTDSGSPAAQMSATYSIVIAPPPPPVIYTTPPPKVGVINVPYVFGFASTGGPALIWSETGTLPAGLTFATDGTLSGTPTALGSAPITVMAQDGYGQASVPQNFTINVVLHGFTATGNMATARYAHTATLLGNGTVLIAGGDSGVPTATAELFDESSGSFAPTGDMGSARKMHTATLLDDGSVLVVGGIDGSGSLTASAELFDPASNSFTSTGVMGSGRWGHTATRLKDGQVLVTGGSDGSGGPTGSAELFDPATGSFTPTGSMATARFNHTATLLNNGEVLVTGGVNVNNGPAIATSELYDPVARVFRATGNLTMARAMHTATLLKNGQVLVTGSGDASVGQTAELFDPVAGLFRATGSMAHWRLLHTATLLHDGTVLVSGGDGFGGAELFNPASGLFQPTGGMATDRYMHTATLMTDGKVLVTGGYMENTAEIY
jgi:Galactose oxidase, central domain